MDTQTGGKKNARLALSIEFVAKPEEVQRVHHAIPAAVQDALEDVPGFAGCLVLISDREARLVSVITFWDDAERLTQCSRRTRWIQRVLSPCVDHCLRVRTLDAYAPGTGSAVNAADKIAGARALSPCTESRTDEAVLCIS